MEDDHTLRFSTSKHDLIQKSHAVDRVASMNHSPRCVYFCLTIDMCYAFFSTSPPGSGALRKAGAPNRTSFNPKRHLLFAEEDEVP